MKRITLDDIQRYVDMLPEPARQKYIAENWKTIKWLYDREKEDEENAQAGTQDN